MTIIEIIRRRADEFPSDVAIRWNGGSWTARQLYERILGAADQLTASGILRGDRVAIHAGNCPGFITALLGCFAVGAIAVPVNNRFKAPEIGDLFARVSPSLYVGSDAFTRVAFGGSPTLLTTPCLMLPSVGFPERRARHASNDYSSEPSRPCLLLATSGSTGTPKIVVHTEATLITIATRYSAFGLASGDTMLNASPMVHAGGLFNLLASLCGRGSMVLLGKFDAHEVLDAIERYKCTWYKGLPFMFSEIAKLQSERPRDVGSLRLAICTGDKCPDQIREKFEQTLGIRLHTGWASTEAATSLVYDRDFQDQYVLHDGVEGKLLAVDGAKVANGEAGELWLRGQNVSPDYWEHDSNSAAANGGWFATGDLMRFVGPRNLRFAGRLKNLIVRGGSNISPVEVEDVLRTCELVSDVAVFGLPNLALGQRVMALVELKEGADPSLLDEALIPVLSRLSDYKTPELIEVVKSLPRTANGKTDRARLVEAFEASRATMAHAS
ncbi:class I adenylate-forming enzyme family protein [Rhizobium ruizarguesonis]|uniref:class I adenylate-forming enzyme family protein n=1 Tax=Rhizobium ruizarguesonis TaxID=2081791 RepID=UPI0010310C03|nr:class I adenylate-forming enzyme family protein [Rhizobium ruizarguesonis]TAT96120.1 long-chain fatty acid--CoA ligase [Rhizobium ruizarguesonis]